MVERLSLHSLYIHILPTLASASLFLKQTNCTSFLVYRQQIADTAARVVGPRLTGAQQRQLLFVRRCTAATGRLQESHFAAFQFSELSTYAIITG